MKVTPDSPSLGFESSGFLIHEGLLGYTKTIRRLEIIKHFGYW
jgi:hypothetical protein